MRTIICYLLSFFLCIHIYAENIYEESVLSEVDRLKFDYFFLESLRLKEKGETTNAYNCMKYALQIDTTSAAALYEISGYLFEIKENNRGLIAMKKAVEYDPKNSEYKLALANLYSQTNQFTEAIQLYENLVKEDPQNLELYLFLIELYLQEPNLENINNAIHSLNGLENNIGINEMVSMQKYQLYRSIDNREKAIQEIEQLINKFPTEAKYLIILGDFYLSENNNKEALNFYTKAAGIDPQNPYYFISMANYYDSEGNEEEATKQIENALNNPALDIEIKLGILSRYIQTLYLNNKNIEKGNALFETLMEQHPQDRELNMLYGQFLLTQNKIEDAKFQFQIVTEATPDELTAWMPLLELAIKENDAVEIISIAEQALIHFPEVSEFYFYKATAYLMKKEYEIALNTYTEGLLHIPDDNPALSSTFYGQMGDIYFQLGNKKEAYENYEKALQLNGRNINVLNNYAYHLSVNKEDLDKAERMAATAVQLQPESSTYLDTYAWVFFQKGNYSLAKFYIESALTKDKTPSKVLLEHYGDILYKAGETEKAVEQWKKALAIEEEDAMENINEDLLIKKINDKTYYEE